MVVGSMKEGPGGSWGAFWGNRGVFWGSWAAFWGSEAPLEANIVEISDKRAKEVVPVNVPHPFFWKSGAKWEPKGAKKDAKGNQNRDRNR